MDGKIKIVDVAKVEGRILPFRLLQKLFGKPMHRTSDVSVEKLNCQQDALGHDESDLGYVAMALKQGLVAEGQKVLWGQGVQNAGFRIWLC